MNSADAARGEHPDPDSVTKDERSRDRGCRVAALSNVCQHQNGPLGEGRIVDGCVTCPWHGYQYRPEDGRSPPPFTEAVPTFAVRVERGRVLVATTPCAPGTVQTPATVPEGGA